MKFKLNTLVAAVVLSAASMSVNAAFSENNGNSEFIFSAWNPVTEVGYTYDLNWNQFLNNFVGIDQAATTAGNALLAANANVPSSLIGTNGIIFDDVLTGLPFAGESLENAQWNLLAFDSVGRNRLLITQDNTLNLFSSNSNQVRSAVTLINTYSATSNELVDPTADDGFAVSTIADGASYAGIYGAGYNNNVGDTTNLFGESSNLYFRAQVTQASSAQPGFLQQLTSFSGDSIVARTYLQDGQWRLQIAAVTVAAVPEPETYAMLLAGLGFIGAIARRRNKAA